jgi:hypothetical protein
LSFEKSKEEEGSKLRVANTGIQQHEVFQQRHERANGGYKQQSNVGSQKGMACFKGKAA